MTIAEFASLAWMDERRPLIEPPGLSPMAADPRFLFPEETPDGAWRNLGIVAWNAMRPFVRRFPDGFRLYDEKYRQLAIPLQLLPRRPQWSSRIEVRFSRDLRSCGPPRTLIAPALPWQQDGGLAGQPLHGRPDAGRRPCR